MRRPVKKLIHLIFRQLFGKVTDGMDVVDKIATVPTGSFGYMQDVPKYLIQIENIEII